jgi:hypothetical protein
MLKFISIGAALGLGHPCGILTVDRLAGYHPSSVVLPTAPEKYILTTCDDRRDDRPTFPS